MRSAATAYIDADGNVASVGTMPPTMVLHATPLLSTLGYRGDMTRSRWKAEAITCLRRAVIGSSHR